MRKFTLMLLAAMFTITMGAQTAMLKKGPALQKPATAKMLRQSPERQLIEQGMFAQEGASRKNVIGEITNELVTPPADLVTERYRLNGSIKVSGWETVSRTILIGFDGNDVYLQGFMYYLPEAWIKGTLSEDHSTVSFPMQFVGNIYNSDNELRDVYFWPATYITDDTDEGSWQPIDAVFNFNEDMKTFVLQQEVVTYIFENTLTDGLRYFAVYDSELTITSDIDTVEVPDDLVTEAYQLEGIAMNYDYDAEDWYADEEFVRSVQVAYDEDHIYIKGLCSYIPGAWVKGDRQGDKYVLANGQYFGIYIYEGEAYPIYLVGYDKQEDKAADIVLELDEETGTLTTQQWVSLSAIADDVLAYEIYSDVALSHILDVAAVPETPEIAYFEYDPDYEMGLAELEIPTVDVDGRPLMTSKLSYQIFTDYGDGVEPYVFLADWHEGLEEDMTVVPYDFEDDIDFLRGGEMVLFYSIEEGLKRIGVQSIYEGGGKTNKSEISWYLVDEDYEPTAVSSTTGRSNGETVYFDLQGRHVTDQTKGLLIKQTRKADGSINTVKVVRK